LPFVGDDDSELTPLVIGWLPFLRPMIDSRV
jgi:hypothetical protein